MKRIQLTISLVLLAGVLGAGVWLYLDTRTEPAQGSIGEMLGQDVDLLMSGDVLIQERSQGRLSLEIAGQDLAYMEDTNLIKLEEPRIRVWPEDGGSISIQGDKGQYFMEQPEIEITGGIQAVSDDGYRLQTEWIRYSPSENMVETEAEVVISRPDFRLTGRGMKFDLENSRLEVASQARLVIERLNPEKR